MIQQEVGIVPLLQGFYKASKIKFDDESSGFKAKAKQAVVRLQVSAVFSHQPSECTVWHLIYFHIQAILELQQGEDRYRAAWEKICQISRNEFDSVYKRLGVELEEKVLFLSTVYQ